MTKIKCGDNKCFWNINGECSQSNVTIKVEQVERQYWFGTGTYIEKTYTCEGFKSGEDNND